MRLHDVVSAPWAITPEMFTEVQGIYARHCRGEKIDLQSLEARIGQPLNNAQSPLDVTADGVAVISIEGVIAKRANLLTRISGGCSAQVVSDQFAAALADDGVKSIVLMIDSPGGTVDGTQALADQIYAARGQKPITAYTDGTMCSAAYWIGSSADQIFIAGDTTQVGSIGVIATHVDSSMADAQRGVKVTEITAGRYKASGSPNAPLGAGEVVLQDAVDHIYGVFLSTVARNRGVDVETAHKDMADGRVFLGQKAITAGLVDGVATFAQVIASSAALSAVSPMAQVAGAAPRAVITHEETTMDKLTVERVRTDAPEVAKAIEADAYAKGEAAGREAGAVAERERIQAVEKLSRPGHEALVSEMKYDGKTTGPEAAVRVLSAIDAKQAEKLRDLKDDAAGAKVEAVAEADKAPVDPVVTARKAQELIASEAKRGVKLTAAEAVSRILAD